MHVNDPARLDELVALILDSAKYRSVSRELIVDVGTRELREQRSFKEAVKATKNKLHQVAGAFLDSRPRYDQWATLLQTARDAGPDELRAACASIMEVHASTRERIPIVQDFYESIFAALPPVHSVLDLACGLNPLALPWMPLATGATYTACDIYHDMTEFLEAFFPIAGIDGHAQVCDLIRGIPKQEVDLALVLKALPTLEQLDRDAGLRLLRSLRARAIVVSFPARSLGGRNKHMVETYGERFEAIAAAEGWTTRRFAFSTELAFLVTTDDQ
jgi:16S rRNA (guanine(1405)-N(7))-methyltransferase